VLTLAAQLGVGQTGGQFVVLPRQFGQALPKQANRLCLR
jgi:hypothetical protein